ncbi:MAG: PolC-type DNA polymerase III [Erysipelotrichaceae bacterium]|nr:PolC-type DNA polymerase III [Erysipelotrichaceae bacterium]
MTLILNEIANELSIEDYRELCEATVKAVRFFRSNNLVEIELECQGVLPYASYKAFRDALKDKTGSEVRVLLSTGTNANEISNVELHRYLEDLYDQHPETSMLSSAVLIIENSDKTVRYLFSNPDERELASAYMGDVEKMLASIGLEGYRAVADVQKLEIPEIKDVHMSAPASEEAAPAPKPQKKTYYRTKQEDYTKIELKDIHDPISDIQFDCDVFAVEITEIKKTGRIIQSLSVFDGTDAIIVKRFENNRTTREEINEIGKGDRIRIFGRIEYDNFARDLVCMPSTVEKLEKEKIVDLATEKRIEWHMHSNMSEMDGVCDIKEIVNYAFDIGHKGIVITDHADVQSFVKAFNAAKGCQKKDPERGFKVGLGCEMNMCNDELLIVRNPSDQKIDDCEYISFDLETTGLSCHFDHVIEFGGVKIKNQTVVDTKQLFIKPPVMIPAFISSKTNITNAMVADARSFKDACDEIIEWIGDAVLVAHNATFDIHFLNEELKRIGREPLHNTVIDTLDMSRAVLKERRAYRLGNIARNYHVSYDEEVAHRADYDADVLGSVFLCLLRDAKSKFGAETIRDLQTKIQGSDSFAKSRRMHICAVAKNHDGIRDLYKLVTESNTKTLAVMGKASGKEGTDVAAEARILRSSIASHRENLLIGSACCNGEVFELACNGDDERLKEAISFYDYIEVQPLSNFSVFLAMGNVPDLNRLKAVIRRIIDTAEKMGKPVIADSDAHYCKKEEKIFRDVYIMSQGVGGATHPLYIRDDALRMRTRNPDQHIRLTDEMKSEFAWLDDDDLIDRIVVRNPNRLFEQIEEVQPVPSGTYPPHIEGSDDKLREICHNTAKRMYEFEGKVPDIVTNRLEEELDNIIRNGFGVHYYIAHLLVKKSNEDGYVVGSRGSVGSSFTATMSGITEVNALKPHYLCPKCHYSEWIDDPEIKSGFDLPDKVCPHCGSVMKGNGQNIPFQTFLGFNADKTPDIDLNFSNEYQWRAHAFIKEVFGEDHAFRAGTIGTVAEKTAYGYVTGYCEKMNITDMRRTMKDYLASGTQNVKRTTGQHPGGIIIIPDEYIAEDFTPVQYPANDPSSDWKTTHYDFHDIHDNVLKFDILGHVDPTAMRLLQNIADRKPMDIPMNDPETLSLFYSDEALKADTRIYKKETGALGLPEFGTRTTRNVLEETRPHSFSDLVIISGLSHGTDVWSGNAQDLVRAGHPIGEVIGCRDDIMTYLLDKKLEPIDAFRIMEDVRKGKGLREDQEEKMKSHNVPDWYIESCKKIKYMFPKAHAVAYVMMAMRIAWYKVHEPVNFYIQFLSLRCDAYEIETMSKGIEAVRMRMQDIQSRMQDRNAAVPVTNKEKSLYDTLEACEELYARGFRIGNVHLYKSLAVHFTKDPDDDRCIIPPFTVIDGLGANVAKTVEAARAKAEFISKEDILKRTQLSATLIKKLEALGVLEGMQETNQMSLF